MDLSRCLFIICGETKKIRTIPIQKSAIQEGKRASTRHTLPFEPSLRYILLGIYFGYSRISRVFCDGIRVNLQNT